MYEVQPTVTWNRDRWYENKTDSLHLPFQRKCLRCTVLVPSRSVCCAPEQKNPCWMPGCWGEGLNDQVSIMWLSYHCHAGWMGFIIKNQHVSLACTNRLVRRNRLRVMRNRSLTETENIYLSMHFGLGIALFPGLPCFLFFGFCSV